MSEESKSTGLSVAAIWGVIFTVTWIAYIIYEAVTDPDGYQKLDLNELGDFLAGAGGPIVLLWIVIGYFQQSAALRLQQEELRKQVEETKNLVAQSVRQVDLMSEEIEIAKQHRYTANQPRFIMHRISQGPAGANCKITNEGTSVTSVKVSSTKLVDSPMEIPVWKFGADITVQFSSQDCSGELLAFRYIDAGDQTREWRAVIFDDFTISAEFADLLLDSDA